MTVAGFLLLPVPRSDPEINQHSHIAHGCYHVVTVVVWFTRVGTGGSVQCGGDDKLRWCDGSQSRRNCRDHVGERY